ncbi:MAG TPA: heavy-metal-associated domain-containing protein [Burkholderiales bacterium]|nr:heavy-metal-associated domain-containing protein [Burkholderiales bacterium]
MIELTVNDMTCGGCVNSVTKAVKALDSSADVRVDLATKRVSVDGKLSEQDVISALDAAGYEAVKA